MTVRGLSWWVLMLAFCGCAPAGEENQDLGQDIAAPDAAARRLVVVTLNTHSFQEGTSSLQKLESIGRGLAALGADIVGLNEVMSGTFWSYHYKGQQYDGAVLIKAALEKASGRTYHVYSAGFAHWSSGEQMSNVVLSRTPIIASGVRALSTTDFWPAPKEQRNVIWARTTLAGYGPLNVLVTHAWGWGSTDTAKQIAEVKAYLASKLQGDEVLNLVLGDLNVHPDHAAFTAWLGAPTRLVDTFGEANPGSKAATTFKGQHRIDHVLADRRAHSFASALVFDGKTQPVVSDHLGVMTTFTLRP